MTLTRTLDIAAGANPLGVLPFSSALGGMANLTEWWTAGEGHTSSGWVGRKAGTIMSPFNNTSAANLPVPTTGGPNGSLMITRAGVNNQQCLAAPSGSTLIPLAASFSLIFVARPTTNGAVFGNASTDYMWFGYSGTDPNQTVNFATSTTGINSGAAPGNGNADGFKLYVASYEYVSSTSMRYRVFRNGTQIHANDANHAAQLVDNQRLLLFGTASPSPFLNFKGDLVECGIYAGALAATANAADKAAIEAYVSDRLGIF